MSTFFSRITGSLALAVLLVFSQSSAIGQVIVDRKDVGYNYTNLGINSFVKRIIAVRINFTDIKRCKQFQ